MCNGPSVQDTSLDLHMYIHGLLKTSVAVVARLYFSITAVEAVLDFTLKRV